MNSYHVKRLLMELHVTQSKLVQHGQHELGRNERGQLGRVKRPMVQREHNGLGRHEQQQLSHVIGPMVRHAIQPKIVGHNGLGQSGQQQLEHVRRPELVRHEHSGLERRELQQLEQHVQHERGRFLQNCRRNFT